MTARGRKSVLFVPAAAIFLLLAAPLAAERLVMSVSTHRVLITSNFTGTEVVVFGSIEDEDGVPPRALQ